jgi:hypothetical protein
MSRIDNINQAIVTLHESERVTKEVLRQLSRDVLEQLFEDGDIRYCNKIIKVLTPVNKRAWIAFMQEFSGFAFNEDAQEFGKKLKALVEFEGQEVAAWVAKQSAAKAELVDPAWSIWPWSERNLKVEASEFTLDKVTKGVQTYIKKCEKNGIKKCDLIRAIFAAGLDVQDIVAVLEGMEPAQQEEEALM